MTVALDDFIELLSDSGILAVAQLENFIPPKATPKNADELASELVKAGDLTSYQAAAILHGNIKSLFLGNYTIRDKIGAGGMGQVFKAEHRRMRRVVAVKMLPPALTQDDVALARFQREVVAAAKLNHANIVTAYDADEANGVHFLVMEYVDGQDLATLVRRTGPLPIAEAARCILHAARGLEHAHNEGIVHRDVKPANLLLEKKGIVKVLDMGLARVESPGKEHAEITGTGAVMGTVDYMSPEQAFNSKYADARADVYSLGCTLHYLIVGRPLYGGDTVVEKIFAHKEKPIPSLRAARPDVPEPIETIFKKMVAKRAADRYQSMTGIVAVLEELCRGSLPTERNAPLPRVEPVEPLIFPDAQGGEQLWSQLVRGAATQTWHSMAKRRTLSTWAMRLYALVRRPKLAIAAMIAILTGALLVAKAWHMAEKNATEGAVNAAAVPVAATKPDNKPTAARPSKRPLRPDVTRDVLGERHKVAARLNISQTTENTVGMEFALIPDGSYYMGSIGGDANEQPEHRVTISKPFYLAIYETSQKQYENVVGRNPSGFQGPDLPVEMLTWEEAEGFCEALTQETGRRHRLPTEAEWEWACRGGTLGDWSYGDDESQLAAYAWTHENADNVSHPVGKKLPNPLGLYDMHGNVWEYCSDWYGPYEAGPATDPPGPTSGMFRTYRGGSYFFPASESRSSNRPDRQFPPKGTNLGFRVVMEIDEAAK